MKIAAISLLFCLCLGACGQKGALYLPQSNKPQPETARHQTEPTLTEPTLTEPAQTHSPATSAE